MSNTKHVAGNGHRGRYVIRVMVTQPHPINNAQPFTARNHDDAMGSSVMSEAIARASYMVNGPNREVLWSLECWNAKRRNFETVIQGKSTYPRKAPPP